MRKKGCDVVTNTKDKLTDEAVANYLLKRPEIFSNYPHLLDLLEAQRTQSAVVSLVHRQLANQRQLIESIEQKYDALIKVSERNDKIFNKLMTLQDALLACTDTVELIKTLENSAKSMNLTVFIRLKNSAIRHVISDDVARGETDVEEDSAITPPSSFLGKHLLVGNYFDRFFKSHLSSGAYLGRLRQVDRVGLFGEKNSAPVMGSYALLPLMDKQELQGFIAFASDEGGHFQPEMDTLFLRNLVSIFSHLLKVLPWSGEMPN